MFEKVKLELGLIFALYLVRTWIFSTFIFDEIFFIHSTTFAL